MLRSMTGFGAARSEGEGLSARAEIRSVNHRYLLVKTRVPGELSHVEAGVETLVKSRLARGSVTVHVAVERAAGVTPASIDRDAARAYRDQLGALADELDLDEGPGLRDLIALPGVIVASREDEAVKKSDRIVMAAIEEALDELVAMREKEGAALAADLRKNAEGVSRDVAKIEERMPEVVRNSFAALKKRTEELLDGRRTAIDEADLARELALIADRSDVSEELSRLESHLTQLDGMLKKGGAVGRKLDFLVQEMFRETNTIGSKCGDAAVSHLVVEVKTLVERLREQVQNVE